MCERFHDLIPRQSAFNAETQIWLHQFIVARRCQYGKSDQAAIPHTEIRATPQISEYKIVRELCKLWRDCPELVDGISCTCGL